MYSSKIVDTDDPDLFVASMRPTGTDFTITQRGSFRGRAIVVDLERVHAQRGREELARIKDVEMTRIGVIFLTERGPSIILNGTAIGWEQMAVVSCGESYTSRLSGATKWGSMSLTKVDMDAHCGFGSNRRTGGTVFTPPPAALARLRSLHAYLGDLAAGNPRLFVNSQSTRSLELTLIDAMMQTLSEPASDLHTKVRQHHQIIIRGFRSALEAHADMPLHVPEISRLIGVSSRTLRLACQEQLGVSPTQYLMLRRMRSARRALRQADPDVTRVTDIATENGFWELGRFAVKYRQIFGETPSVTLRGVA
jgi:AraC-like DNA-binding protein